MMMMMILSSHIFLGQCNDVNYNIEDMRKRRTNRRPRHDDVDETDEWQQRSKHDAQKNFLPRLQRLQKAHLSTVEDIDQMLLTVRMCYKLHRRLYAV